MIQGQLVLVELGENRTDVQMGVGLDFGTLKSRLNRQGSLQKVERCAHLSNTAVVAGHVVEGHSLTKLIVLAKLLGLLEEVERTVDIFLLEVVDGEDVANLTQLLARASEFARRGTEVHLLDLEQLFQDSDRFHIFAL